MKRWKSFQKLSVNCVDFYYILQGMKRIHITILLFFTTIYSFALSNQVVIAKANKAYSDGLYTNAIDLYIQVMKEGYESPDLYYNIGNAYYKLNDFPSAILFYEKAKKLDPGNDDIDFNLKVANSKIADKIEPLPELFYKRWYRGLLNTLSVDAWAKTTIATFILFLFLGSVFFISRILFLRKLGFWMGIILFILFLCSFFLAYDSYRNINNHKEAIVFSPTVTVKSSPDENSIDLFVIHEGTKVQLIDNIGSWYEIRIANGSVGWLPVTTVEKI